MSSLESIDRELIEQARSIISQRFKPDYHHIGAALRTKSGRVFAAVHQKIVRVDAHIAHDYPELHLRYP